MLCLSAFKLKEGNSEAELLSEEQRGGWRTCWGWNWGVAWAGVFCFILFWFWDAGVDRSGVVCLYLHWLHNLGWRWVNNESGVRCTICDGCFLHLFLCSTDSRDNSDQRPRESFTIWSFAFHWFSHLHWSPVRIHSGIEVDSTFNSMYKINCGYEINKRLMYMKKQLPMRIKGFNVSFISI